MAQAKTIPFTRHPYADGSFKKMLIDAPNDLEHAE